MAGRMPLWVALFTLSCATASEIPEESHGSAYSTLEEFCHMRAEAECTSVVVAACKSGGVAACVELRESVCKQAAPQGTSYVPSKAQACLTLLGQVFAKTTLAAGEVHAIHELCDIAIFTGPGPARAPCTTSLDCDTASGLDCWFVPEASSGKCLVPNVVTSGMSCAAEADRCVDGTYCDPVTEVCAPAAEAGHDCAQGIAGSCAEGSKCVGLGPFGASCAALGTTGSKCVSDDDCAHGLCDRPAASGTGSCADSIELVWLDSACEGFHP